MAKRLRLLSIDGGGIRGILPARVLAYIEDYCGRPVHQLFDGVAATSSGAITALALVKPGVHKGRAAELAEFYREYAPAIFEEGWADEAFTVPSWISRWLGIPQGYDLNDLWRPKYAGQGRHRVLDEHYGATHLTQALLPVYIPSYCTKVRTPIIFVSRPEHTADEEFFEATAEATFTEAAMASSAAPTYFPPFSLRRYCLIDGGLMANNPTALAFAHFRGKPGDLVLSLGTGSMQKSYPYTEVAGWGTLNWAGPMLRMALDGQSESAHLALERMLPPATYLRMQGLLYDAKVSDDLDDWQPNNLSAIERLAKTMIIESKARLNTFCDDLMQKEEGDDEDHDDRGALVGREL